MRPQWAVVTIILGLSSATLAQNVTYRWVYRNPYSILDPNAVDAGRGSKNGTVNSLLSTTSKAYQPRLRYSHMSTLSHLPNGSIAAQWQANTKWYEGAANQSIYWAVSDDAGLTWGPSSVLMPSVDGLPIWGPVQYSANGTLHLWYSRSKSTCSWVGPNGLAWACGGDLLFSTSRDPTQSWNTTTIIPWSYEGGIARLTCNGISLNAKGEWLLPYWRELGGGDGCQNVPSLHGTAGVLITADQGKTYTKVNVPRDNSTWMIENAIAQYRGNASSPDMHVQTFRTSTGTALQSWSSDGGFNWTFPVNSTLPNPNSRMDIISLPNNTLVAAFNDSPSKRTPLRLATSTDGGRSWIRNALIEDDPEGSFHYPALLYDAKKDVVLVIYTVGYPPRLVPVSLVLPGLGVKSTSAFASVPDTAPAPAPSANETLPAGNDTAPVAGVDTTSPVPAVNATSPVPRTQAAATFQAVSARSPIAPSVITAPRLAVSARPPVSALAMTTRVTGVDAATSAPSAMSSPNASKSLQASTYSATTNRTGARAPAPAPAVSREARREGDREALSQLGRRLAQAASSDQVAMLVAPVPSPAAGGLRREDVLAHVGGDFDNETSAEEMAENAALADRHAELLTSQGYRMVDGLPGYVLEPDSRGVRELNVQNFQSGLDRNDPGLSMMTSDSTGALTPSDSAQGRRRLLKDRYVREEANYGRVNYGIRVATVNRLDLVNGLISPK